MNVFYAEDNEILNTDDNEDGRVIKGIKKVDKPTPTIDSVMGQWRCNILRIPDFQRKFVWTIEQSSKFIESLLLDIPIPSLMFYKDSESNQLIVDGQQRIKSIIFFIGDNSINTNNLTKDERDRYKFKLTGLSSKSKYNGKSFIDLEEVDKRKLQYECMLDINTITLSDPNDLSSIYYIFERLNTGGTPLKPQEIRNCICASKFNEFLLQLNIYDIWRKFFNESNAIDHLQDVELILRFFALYDRIEQYKRPMKDYLTDYMIEMKNISDEEKTFKEKLFKSTIDAVYLHIGRRAFRPNSGINASVFDSIMLAFAKNLDNIPVDIKDKYEKLCCNKEYNKFCGQSSGDNNSVRNRIQMANDYLFGKVIDIDLKMVYLYEVPVSAGFGNILTDENIPRVEIFTKNRKADFAVKIVGDSMEPEYEDGDIVLVRSQNTLYNGQIGIILYDNDVRCKKYCKNKKNIFLESLNKKYPPVNIASNRKFIIQGLVLEKYIE